MRSAAPLSRVSLVKWRRSTSYNIRQLEFTVVVVASYPALGCEKALRMGARSSLVNESWPQDLPIEL